MNNCGTDNSYFLSKVKEIPTINEKERNLLIGLQGGCDTELRIIRTDSNSVFWDSDFDAEEVENTRLPYKMFSNLVYGYHYSFSELTGEDWHFYALI